MRICIFRECLVFPETSVQRAWLRNTMDGSLPWKIVLYLVVLLPMLYKIFSAPFTATLSVSAVSPYIHHIALLHIAFSRFIVYNNIIDGVFRTGYCHAHEIILQVRRGLK